MKIEITFNLDNAAFREEDGTLLVDEVKNTLVSLGDYIAAGRMSGQIGDSNGNAIGHLNIIGV